MSVSYVCKRCGAPFPQGIDYPTLNNTTLTYVSCPCGYSTVLSSPTVADSTGPPGLET
jgi:DNA-directed RNA polymerase subunit RPC12/RpoP